MVHQILAATSASVSELKKNPMGTVAAGEGFPVRSLTAMNPRSIACPPKPTRRCLTGLRIWN